MPPLLIGCSSISSGMMPPSYDDERIHGVALHPIKAKALLVVCRVKCDANEEQRDGKHDDANKNVHLYSLPISSIRRWIWRWSRKIPKPSNMAVAMASERHKPAKRGRK